MELNKNITVTLHSVIYLVVTEKLMHQKHVKIISHHFFQLIKPRRLHRNKYFQVYTLLMLWTVYKTLGIWNEGWREGRPVMGGCNQIIILSDNQDIFKNLWWNVINHNFTVSFTFSHSTGEGRMLLWKQGEVGWNHGISFSISSTNKQTCLDVCIQMGVMVFTDISHIRLKRTGKKNV